MKKIFTLASFAAAAMMLFSCAKETSAPVENEGGYTYTFALSNPGVKSTLNDGATAYKWEDGDTINVYASSSVKGSVTSAGLATATFESELSEGDKVYATYSYSESNTATNSVVFSIPAEQDGATIQNAMPMYSDALEVEAGTEVSGTFQMNNLGAVLAFKPYSKTYAGETVKYITYAADGVAGSFDAVDITSSSPALANGTEASVKATASVSVAEAKADAECVYMVVAPAAASTTGTITVVTDKGSYSKTLPSALELEANDLLTVALNLDKFDVAKGSAANPYTVAEALELITSGKSDEDAEVYVKGIISQIDEVSTSYGNATYYISDDGKTTSQLEIFRGYYLDGEKFTSTDQIHVENEVLVCGKLVYYNSKTPEITSGSKIVSISNVKTDPALAYSETTASATIGSENTFPTLTNSENVSVTYTSSDESVATINEDGEVTLVAAGSTVITASHASDDTYYASEASYTLTVVAEGGVAPVTVTVDFSKQGYSNGTQYTTTTVDNVTVTFGSGSNDGKYYDTGSAMRVYSGGYCKVAAPGTITSIAYTYSSSSNCPVSSSSENNYGSVDSGTLDGLGTTSQTWTGSASSVTLTRKEASGHWRLQKVVVTYTPSSES